MSLKLKVAQRAAEEGDLASSRQRVKDMGFTCELVADWASFKTEQECGRIYNFAFSDVESALASGFREDKLIQDTFNSAVKTIQVGASDTETNLTLDGDTLKVVVNFGESQCIPSGQIRDYLMDNL